MTQLDSDALFETVPGSPWQRDASLELPEIAAGSRHMFVVETTRDDVVNGEAYAELFNLASNLRLCIATVPIELAFTPPVELMLAFVTRPDQAWRISAYLEETRAGLNGHHGGLEAQAYLEGVPVEIIDRGARWSDCAAERVFVVGSKAEVEGLRNARRRPLPVIQGQIAFASLPHVLRSRRELESLGVGILRCLLRESAVEALFPDRKGAVVRTLHAKDIEIINNDPTAEIELFTSDRGWLSI